MIDSEEPQAAGGPRETRRGRGKLLLTGLVTALVLAAIFVPPFVNLGKYRRSITRSISAALGRPVAVGDMQLRLLPTPGITMTDFTVAEDPAFGYEPALHANSVVVSLRLTSLWRGRLEVSRISLDEASLNLVKSDAGQWSIGSVLLRAAQLPNEATGQRHAGAHPRFPYIEATSARINFKQGVEKRPFALMNAKFAMWQANRGAWQLRLKAQPARTDLQLHLSDTGMLQVEGSLGRAGTVHTMPVTLHAEWSGAQLGQVSRLLTGTDSGWRGDLDVTANLNGTAGDFTMKNRVQIANLRRQEFQPTTTVNVDATCASHYQNAQRVLGQITCFQPAGPGHLLLTGEVRGKFEPGTRLQLEINQTPAQLPLSLLGLLRPRADSVTATGTVNGGFAWTRGEHPSLSGDATATGVTLSYPGGTLTLPGLHLAASATAQPAGKRGRRKKPETAGPTAIVLEPTQVSLGGAPPVTADGRLTRAGFTLHLAGQAALGPLIAAGANFGLLENALTLAGTKGHAEVNTTTTGNWMAPLAAAPYGGIATTGVVKVADAEVQPRFLHEKVEIASADVNLGPQQISWQNVALRYAGMAMRGSITYPTACIPPAPCAATFSLEPGETTAAAIETALAGQRAGFLGQMLADLGAGAGVAWPNMTGTLQSRQISLGRLPMHNVAARLSVQGNALTIDSLDAAALGGTIHATGAMTVTGGIPHWNLELQVKGVKASDGASVFNEHWGSGTASGAATLTMSGYRTPDLASSAAGSFRVLWQNGGMASAAGPIEHFDRWTASGTIGSGALTLTDSAIATGGRNRAVAGTVRFDRRIHLLMDTSAGKVTVGGTLARPVIVKATAENP
ncbi:MAG TPA: AsmA family protein [Acidobacteriaceae bacterium]